MGDFPGASPAVGSSRSRSAVNPKGAWSETGRSCVPLGCPREGTYAQKLWLRSWLSLRMLMQVEIAWKVLRQKVPRECSVVGDFPGASPAVGSSRSRSPVIPARVCALRQVAVGCLVVALGKNPRAEALVAIVVVRPNVITGSDRLDSVAAESSRGICQKLLESVPRDCFFWTPVWERSHQGLAERMSGRKAGTLWRTLGTKLPGRMSEASGHTSFSAVCRNSLRGCLAKPPWPSVRLFPPLAGLPGSGEVWDESSCVPQGCPRERSHAQKLVVILL